MTMSATRDCRAESDRLSKPENVAEYKIASPPGGNLFCGFLFNGKHLL